GILDMSGVPLELRYRRPQAHRLHVRLEQFLESIVDLSLTDNRRRMISSKRRRGRLEVRAHHMFMGCKPATAEALATLAGGRSNDVKAARALLREYIRQNRDAIAFEPTADELRTRGQYFN